MDDALSFEELIFRWARFRGLREEASPRRAFGTIDPWVVVDVKIEIDARAGGSVTASRFESAENRLARLRFREDACETVGDTELSRSGTFGARTTFVPVAVAHHADDVTHVEGVPQHPLEHAPAAHELDKRAKFRVDIFSNVGVASADV